MRKYRLFHLYSHKSLFVSRETFFDKVVLYSRDLCLPPFSIVRVARVVTLPQKGSFVHPAAIGHVIRALSRFSGVCRSYFCLSPDFLSARVVFTVIFMCFPLSHFKNRFCHGLLPRKRGHFWEPENTFSSGRDQENTFSGARPSDLYPFFFRFIVF